LWSPECPHDGAGVDGAGLGVAQLDVAAGACSAAGAAGVGGAAGFGAAGFGAAGFGAAGFGAAGLTAGAAFFALLLAPAFLADFFGAAAFDFLADFFADFDFLADFVAVFFADFLADFFDDFFADFFFAVTTRFLLLFLFLPAFFFLPLAIMNLLLRPIRVYRALRVVRLKCGGRWINSILAGDRLSPNREAQSCAPQELTYRRQSAPCIRCCPQQSCPA
jgi:hypothetical protein